MDSQVELRTKTTEMKEWLWGGPTGKRLWIKTRILRLDAVEEEEELIENMKKSMIQPEELGLKLVLNSIFNKVPEDIVLCSRHAAARRSHHGRGNGKKMSRVLLRRRGLNECSQINSMLCRGTVCFCFCPDPKKTAGVFALPYTHFVKTGSFIFSTFLCSNFTQLCILR